MLHGREAEVAHLASMLAAAAEGRGEAVLLHGEAGAGKSALLDAAAGLAADHLVLRTVGLESESPLPFAALHRLLRPLSHLFREIPEPQAQALGAAFGEVTDARVDPFVIGLATLSVLSEAALEQPVLCLVDDAQWLDSASAEALLFTARRTQADPVTFVFAVRDGFHTFSPEGIPTLPLDRLSGAAARAVLESQSGGLVADHVVDQLIERTAGNPLALTEIPRRLSSAQLQGNEPLPTVLPLGEDVEKVFLERCRVLSSGAQTAMLVAAADDSTRLDVVLRAGAELAAEPADLQEAEESGLLFIASTQVTVRHPLVRSAVYQAATVTQRHRVHAALGRVLTDAGDTDRAAWHLAAAAEGPDEEVAQALDRAGSRAAARGGYAGASAAYERAATLSTTDDARVPRLLEAARNAYASGQTSRASTLLTAARQQSDDATLLADIGRLRGRIEVVAGSATESHRIFIQAARAIAPTDPLRALEMAALAGILLAHGADSGTRLPPDAVPTEVRPEDPIRVRCLKAMLAAMDADSAGDPAAALAALRPGLDAGSDIEDRDIWANLANAALHLGDDVSHRHYLTAMLSAARDQGAVMEALYALHRIPLSELVAGEWEAVRGRADEALSLARVIGLPSQATVPLVWLTLLAALQGKAEYADRLAEAESAAAAHPLGVMTGPVDDLLHWARATHAAGEGSHQEALHQLARMRIPVLIRIAASDRVHGAVRAGEANLARQWIEELEGLGRATGLPWALAGAASGRALLADSDTAAAQFEEALAHHAAAGRPYEHAKAQLSYAEFLRRAQRRVDARAVLQEALGTFEDLGAAPLAARAAEELRASGVTARKRDPSTALLLTPTELRIARLVSQGLSNKDVAAQLWCSPRTVAFHLRNIFTKTGVTSRGGLAQLPLG